LILINITDNSGYDYDYMFYKVFYFVTVTFVNHCS